MALEGVVRFADSGLFFIVVVAEILKYRKSPAIYRSKDPPTLAGAPRVDEIMAQNL